MSLVVAFIRSQSSAFQACWSSAAGVQPVMITALVWVVLIWDQRGVMCWFWSWVFRDGLHPSEIPEAPPVRLRSSAEAPSRCLLSGASPGMHLFMCGSPTAASSLFSHFQSSARLEAVYSRLLQQPDFVSEVQLRQVDHGFRTRHTGSVALKPVLLRVQMTSHL